MGFVRNIDQPYKHTGDWLSVVLLAKALVFVVHLMIVVVELKISKRYAEHTLFDVVDCLCPAQDDSNLSSCCVSSACAVSTHEADAACRRPVSFLRMLHHCIMAPAFRPRVRPANVPQGRQGRRHDRQSHWFPIYAILAV